MLSCFSHVQLFATLWTVAFQAPLSMGFSRQEYWSGLLCPPPGNLPKPVIEPNWQTGSIPLAPPGKHPYLCIYKIYCTPDTGIYSVEIRLSN